MIYTFKIKYYLDKLNKQNDAINYYNAISEKILNFKNEDFKKGIWNLIINLKEDKYNFKINGYKKNYAISQLIAPFANSNIFAFEIRRYGYCYNCKYEENLHEYLGPIIQLNNDDLDLSIPNAIEKRFENLSLICKKCGWFKDKIITNYATYSLIINLFLQPFWWVLL